MGRCVFSAVSVQGCQPRGVVIECVLALVFRPLEESPCRKVFRFPSPLHPQTGLILSSLLIEPTELLQSFKEKRGGKARGAVQTGSIPGLPATWTEAEAALGKLCNGCCPSPERLPARMPTRGAGEQALGPGLLPAPRSSALFSPPPKLLPVLHVSPRQVHPARDTPLSPWGPKQPPLQLSWAEEEPQSVKCHGALEPRRRTDGGREEQRPPRAGK